MIIDCISDLHGHYPKLEGGDLLIVAGDLTAIDKESEYTEFAAWLALQKYQQTIVIAGNHDNKLQNGWEPFEAFQDSSFNQVHYLCDSGTEFEGFKIYGSPWTKTFEGMNPHCKAFTVDTEEELAEKWALIPSDIDILITHCPVASILDEVDHNGQITNVGSLKLINAIVKTQPKLHVCGHVHEGYGIAKAKNLQLIENLFPNTIFVNASHVNERYEPVNKPIRIEQSLKGQTKRLLQETKGLINE